MVSGENHKHYQKCCVVQVSQIRRYQEIIEMCFFGIIDILDTPNILHTNLRRFMVIHRIDAVNLITIFLRQLNSIILF